MGISQMRTWEGLPAPSGTAALTPTLSDSKVDTLFHHLTWGPEGWKDEQKSHVVRAWCSKD